MLMEVFVHSSCVVQQDTTLQGEAVEVTALVIASMLILNICCFFLTVGDLRLIECIIFQIEKVGIHFLS